MSMTRTVADKAMTDAQLLRHLRRHPHRRAVGRLLAMVGIKHRGNGLGPRKWSRTLEEIWMEIMR